jgi:hypothetical protein
MAHLASSFYDALDWRPIQPSFFTATSVLYCGELPQNPTKGAPVKAKIFAFVVVVLGLLSILAGETKTRTASPSAKLDRGKYLVENIGMCGDCHTAHNEKGEPIKEQWLKGTELPFKPTVPMPWADKSVNIAGLPGWEHDAAVKFFMTGIAYNGLPARPPMPQYRYSRQDAEAIVAYLKSLAPAK